MSQRGKAVRMCLGVGAGLGQMAELDGNTRMLAFGLKILNTLGMIKCCGTVILKTNSKCDLARPLRAVGGVRVIC